jgi:hypothetical protein
MNYYVGVYKSNKLQLYRLYRGRDVPFAKSVMYHLTLCEDLRYKRLEHISLEKICNGYVTVTVNVQKLIDYLSFSFTIVSVKC